MFKGSQKLTSVTVASISPATGVLAVSRSEILTGIKRGLVVCGASTIKLINGGEIRRTDDASSLLFVSATAGTLSAGAINAIGTFETIGVESDGDSLPTGYLLRVCGGARIGSGLAPNVFGVGGISRSDALNSTSTVRRILPCHSAFLRIDLEEPAFVSTQITVCPLPAHLGVSTTPLVRLLLPSSQSIVSQQGLRLVARDLRQFPQAGETRGRVDSDATEFVFAVESPEHRLLLCNDDETLLFGELTSETPFSGRCGREIPVATIGKGIFKREEPARAYCASDGSRVRILSSDSEFFINWKRDQSTVQALLSPTDRGSVIILLCDDFNQKEPLSEGGNIQLLGTIHAPGRKRRLCGIVVHLSTRLLPDASLYLFATISGHPVRMWLHPRKDTCLGSTLNGASSAWKVELPVTVIDGGATEPPGGLALKTPRNVGFYQQSGDITSTFQLANSAFEELGQISATLGEDLLTTHRFVLFTGEGVSSGAERKGVEWKIELPEECTVLFNQTVRGMRYQLIAVPEQVPALAFSSNGKKHKLTGLGLPPAEQRLELCL